MLPVEVPDDSEQARVSKSDSDDTCAEQTTTWTPRDPGKK